MSQYFFSKKIFPKEFKQEISTLYELGLDIYEIEYIVNLRMREIDLKLKD